MWKVINVTDDRTYSSLHRTASKREYEPSIAGVRLPMGHMMLLENEQFLRLKPKLLEWKRNGTIDFAPAEGNEAPKAGVAIRVLEKHKIKKGSTSMEQVEPYVSPSQPNAGEALGGHKPDASPETHSSTDPLASENQIPKHGFDVPTDPLDMKPPAPNVPEMQPHIEQAVDRVVPNVGDDWRANASVTEEHAAAPLGAFVDRDSSDPSNPGLHHPETPEDERHDDSETADGEGDHAGEGGQGKKGKKGKKKLFDR